MKCPDCGAVLPGPVPECPGCGLPLLGPAAHELWQVDRALAGLSEQQARLRNRRTELLSALRAGAPPPPPPAEAAPFKNAPPMAPGPHPGPPPWSAGSQREVSPRTARNVLLGLGGLLLTVAAVVFTVVSWGMLGVGGRAAVLAVFTLLVMLAPVALIRRGLTATAETMAGFAVALLLLDGYAARLAGLLGADAVDGASYTAGVLGVTALILVGYARLTGLRGPAPIAVVLAQPVLPLLAVESATWLTAALVATTALDVALVRYGRGAVRVTAVVAGALAGAFALLFGALYVLEAPTSADALGRSAPLVALALLGGFVTWLLARRKTADDETWAALVAAGTALAVITVPAALARPALETGWRSLAFLVPALAVVLAVTWLPWRKVRAAGRATGGVVALLVVLALLPRLVVTLTAPLIWLDLLWTGTWRGEWPPFDRVTPADLVVLCAVAATLLIMTARSASRPLPEHGERRENPGGPREQSQEDPGGRPGGEEHGGVGGWWARAAVVGAVMAAALVVALAPDVFAMPYPVAMAAQVVVAVALTAAATLGRARWWAVSCAVVAAGAAGRAAAYAFGDEMATLTVLPVLAVAAGAVALAARVRGLRTWGLGFAALFLGLEAVAAGFALGWRVPVALSAGFAVAGVLVLVRSLRSGAARELRYTGTVLLLIASWLRLGADEVTVVEAYTVPASLVLLGVGWWRRRGGEEVSSWAAYGPGLAFTMLPSLLAVYAQEEWLRSLVLGVLSLAVLVAGARFRLQAPTVLGAAVVAGVAVRELAPYVSELLLVVPRWVPIAVGGLLLVAVGATYEARMRDLRRLRATLTAMD